MEKRLGLVALLVTLVFTACGLPMQIWNNYLAQSTGGLSLVMCVLWLFTFVSWIAYAAYKKDRYIMIANVTGAFFVTIILVQYAWYR